jgi:ketosteroid isomerase-like protein
MSARIHDLLRMAAAVALPWFFLATQAQEATYVGRHESAAEDLKAIKQVADEFRAALVAKDARRLSALFLNSDILFTSPAGPEAARKSRDTLDVNFSGIRSGGAVGFLQFVADSKASIEERFHNLQVTQDQHVAWVMFDFEFLEDGKVENYGIETWQLLKTVDGRWKIFSVVWSSRGAPK